MDFRLKVFVTVAKFLSFTKAAQELKISQPAVTKHVQELEKMYKVQLFERIGGKIYPTAAGTTLLEHANQILAQYEILSLEMSKIHQQDEYADCLEYFISSSSSKKRNSKKV